MLQSLNPCFGYKKECNIWSIKNPRFNLFLKSNPVW
jgi:hypothetical protein